MPNHTDHLRHNFAIWVLGRKPGLFKPQRYLYSCLRCKWSFVVNDDQRGAIRAVPDDGSSLTDSEALERLATFEDGPCPGQRALRRIQPARERIVEMQTRQPRTQSR